MLSAAAWRGVVSMYRDFAIRAVDLEGTAFVAPWSPDGQAGTLQLIAEHRDELRRLADAGAELIVADACDGAVEHYTVRVAELVGVGAASIRWVDAS